MLLSSLIQALQPVARGPARLHLRVMRHVGTARYECTSTRLLTGHLWWRASASVRGVAYVGTAYDRRAAIVHVIAQHRGAGYTGTLRCAGAST